VTRNDVKPTTHQRNLAKPAGTAAANRAAAMVRVALDTEAGW
jgi:hypothetical protein